MIECIRFRPINKGCLVGFADILVTSWKFEILGVTLYKKDNQTWINLPSKEFNNEKGVKAYAPIVRFQEKSHYDEFCKHAKHAIEEWLSQNDASK